MSNPKPHSWPALPGQKLCICLLLALLAIPAPLLADEIQDDFDAAMTALDEERIYTARRLLSELLAEHPSLNRARVELARADYLARDYDAAEAEVLQVLEDPELPESVRTTLLAFLAQIRDDQRSFGKKNLWSGQFYAGAMYDSNVNFGVARDIVDIGGQFFQVDPGSQELSDGAGVLNAGLVHTFNPNSRFKAGEKTGFFLWQSELLGYYRGYLDETDFNLGVATLRTGPVWVVPEAWRASIGLQLDQIFLGNDDLALFASINPEITWALNPLTEVSVGFTATGRDYDQDEDDGRDGTFYRGTAGINRLYIDNKLAVQGIAGYSDFGADDDRFSYSGLDLLLGATYNAWRNGAVFTSVGYRQFDFVGAEPAPVNEPRNDDEYRFTVGLSHLIDSGLLEDWAVQAGYNYTRNVSNIELFDFDRHEVSVGLARSF